MKTLSTLFSVMMFSLSSCSTFPIYSHPPTADNSPTPTQIILPANTPVPSTTTMFKLDTAQTPNPELNWSVVFEQELEEYYWSLGIHYYQITSDCPDVDFLGDLERWPLHFSVDEDNFTYLFPNDFVDLLYDTTIVNYDGYSVVSSIRPQQKTRFRFGFKDLTIGQATYAAETCKVNVIIDEGKTIPLSPLVQRSEPWYRGYFYRH